MELDIVTLREVVDQAIDEQTEANVGGGIKSDGNSLIAELHRQVLLLDGMNRISYRS